MGYGQAVRIVPRANVVEGKVVVGPMCRGAPAA